MYSIPPRQTPDAVQWPRTLLLPPRRRLYDWGNLAIRLVMVLIQALTMGAKGFAPFQHAMLGGLWLTLLLGPTAELLPVTWHRLARVLRILQLGVGILTAIAVLWWWRGV